MGQSPIVGKWVTIDDGTSEAKSVVEIFEQKGEYYGKVVKQDRKDILGGGWRSLRT